MTAAAKETAFVLPEDAVATGDAVNFPDIPGVWVPGEPIGVSYLGKTVKEMRDLIAEHGLPLKEAKADAPPDGFLDRTGGIVSGAEYDSAPETTATRSASGIPGLSEEQAKEREAYDAQTAAEPPPALATAPTGEPAATDEGSAG